ncbi:hypothetical protein [Cronobacter malonaticus]|uniref:hypothetical protein n=1 Tax=Cronobacter malonaticus TaxID=413503 RepID=UPI002937230B|nr:hypothetical protein [Cronobacter malonaticus]
MSTISTEQAKDLRNAFECWQQDYDPVEDKEQYEMFGLGVVAMDELLALRKEREKAEPVAWMLTDNEFGHSVATKAGFTLNFYRSKGWGVTPLYTAPPAPVADDSLPFDPQIAEYEQMMEAEQAQADTASQQFESLAGKAVVPQGWKLVPVEPTPDMREAFHQANEEWEEGGAKWSPDHQWKAMLSAAPEPCK